MTFPPPNPEQDRGSTHQHQYYRYATPIAVAALIVSCLAAGFSWYQAHLIGQANELTRQNSIISQRASVALGIGQIQIVRQSEPKAVNISAFLINNGNTPTKHLQFIYRCVPSADELPEPWSLFRQTKEQFEHLPVFIGAHGTVPTGCSFPWDQIQQIANKKLFGYVMADIIYFDRLDPGERHRTQMALFMSEVNIIVPKKIKMPNGDEVIADPNYGFEAAFEGRGQHNCADEECPPD
jgi:hypothetical protein